ncbi:hypothetical protein Lal_00020154 [Lupinus albus]|uniref:Dof zinc finger protein n=1 Tax=Lupinus albus TaxID=3870 RepID=A0A6A4Q5C5_LUPAL|nr:putative transcription factor C2C2-Dof family [Lupinus albus]KAF1871361.1 hypothetical protein Lal_00020154 [Lupinus albus]
MFPQRHSIISGSMLEQMLHLQSNHMPLPTPIMDKSSSWSWKPHIEVAPNCPRCASTNTKFCYYNNYSLSQPRYFCKGCRRYWTKGGSLRSVPVGGGCRKNRRGKLARHSPQSGRLANDNSGSDDRDSSSETNVVSNDIDMAVVFAKFLNQNPNSGEANNNPSVCSNKSPTRSSTQELSIEAEIDAVVQAQEKPCDDPNDADGGKIAGVVEELSFSGIDELNGFLGEDIIWSNDVTMFSSVNANWQQPMMQMQLQELEESLMPLNEDGDQILPISSTINLLNDSWCTWSSFDLPTMDLFSSTP